MYQVNTNSLGSNYTINPHLQVYPSISNINHHNKQANNHQQTQDNNAVQKLTPDNQRLLGRRGEGWTADVKAKMHFLQSLFLLPGPPHDLRSAQPVTGALTHLSHTPRPWRRRRSTNYRGKSEDVPSSRLPALGFTSAVSGAPTFRGNVADWLGSAM